ncbi:MAG TPA: hypothetical protein VFQ61_18450 [Polyangiaceae bacterium]|nr:hypothetical protein [Polyangiaceae bacterium]
MAVGGGLRAQLGLASLAIAIGAGGSSACGDEGESRFLPTSNRPHHRPASVPEIGTSGGATSGPSAGVGGETTENGGTPAQGGAPAQSGGEPGTGALGGSAGANNAGASSVFGGAWSCGVAAGLCSCVHVDLELEAPGLLGSCAASDCCFEQQDGTCSCRMPDALLDCARLASALGATRARSRCPE